MYFNNKQIKMQFHNRRCLNIAFPSYRYLNTHVGTWGSLINSRNRVFIVVRTIKIKTSQVQWRDMTLQYGLFPINILRYLHWILINKAFPLPLLQIPITPLCWPYIYPRPLRTTTHSQLIVKAHKFDDYRNPLNLANWATQSASLTRAWDSTPS